MPKITPAKSGSQLGEDTRYVCNVPVIFIRPFHCSLRPVKQLNP